VGVKSYGRAPTFLLLTGYEQARSVAAALAGDRAAADDVQLVLPETGICEDNGVESGRCCGSPQEEIAVTSSGCCGGSAPVKTVPVEACCAPAVVAKDEARTGCGCGVAA
jgi:hypothetical protein